VDIALVLRPAIVFRGHDLVELVALAIGRRDDADLVATPRGHRKSGGPDPTAVPMKREFVQDQIAAKAPRGIGRGRDRGDARPTRKADLLRLVGRLLHNHLMHPIALMQRSDIRGHDEVLFTERNRAALCQG